ncbi:MAG: GGDEF domain-containing response regulator [Psychrobium sp.]
MSKLLIIEDSPLIRKVIKHLASTELSCEFDFAESFAQTKELIANNDYFLALADLNLPDAPNGEVVQLTMEQGISTIVLTATTNEELRKKLLAMGVLDYIFKENRDSYVSAIKLINQLILNQDIKVLVADDSKTLRGYIKSQLSKLLYQVIEAENGVEAIKRLTEHPDTGLLITDYNMPKMNGIELIRHVRQSRLRDEFPIIGLSSSNDPTLSARFIKHGANDFLVTPFMQEEFQWRIIKAMEQIALIKEIRDAANRDYLTKLYNRRYFFNVGEMAFEQAQSDNSNFSVALMDIDFFKKINDNYGHDVGDAVLIEMAAVLNKWFEGMLVARYGGEEFIVVIKDLSASKVNTLLNAFREYTASQQFDIDEHAINFTASIGVANNIGQVETLDDLINQADIALYQAKESGRNVVIWENEPLGFE